MLAVDKKSLFFLNKFTVILANETKNNNRVYKNNFFL